MSDHIRRTEGIFAVMKRRVILPGFRYVQLRDQWILSCHSKLQVFYDEKKDVLLIGHAWQVRPDRESPVREIQKLRDPSVKAVKDMEESWCGRYVLISGGRVFPDAAGSYGVFYCKEGISSDLTLLAEQAGRRRRACQPGEVMNWIPGPGTPYKNIYRLMPDQILDMARMKIRGRQLLSENHTPCPDTEETIRQFTELFDNSLKNLAEMFPGVPLKLALTGGHDSRSLIALACHSCVDFSCYSFEHDSISEGDIRIPKELCARAGVPCRYIKRNREEYDPVLEKEYREHTADLVREEDRLFYAYGQYKALAEGHDRILLLRSSIWETVVCFFRFFWKDDADEACVYDYFELRPGQADCEGLKKYFWCCRQNPQKNLSKRDRFYWEQRDGCWLSSIEQGFDVMDYAVTLQPVNCRLLLTLLMDFPEEERKVREHQERIIRYACPQIADIPYGAAAFKDEPLLQSLKGKASKACRRIKKIGLKRTARLYMKRVSR